MTVYKDFLNQIWGDNEGYVDIARVGETGDVDRHKFFVWPAQREELFAYVGKYAHEDIYFTPALFKGPRRQRVLANYCTVVYGDADTFDLADIKTDPSIVVHTSPGKTHLYWIIDGMTSAQTAEMLSHSVSNEHPKKETGFDDGWSCTKLLRVPGTTNTKYAAENGEVYDVTVEYAGITYELEGFTEFYPAVPEVEFEQREFPETLPTYAQALGSVQSTSRLEEFLSTSTIDKRRHGSEALYGLYTELFRLGATDEVVFVIARRSELNKWSRDGRDNADELLWNDIQRARAKDGVVIQGDEDEDAEAEVTVEPLVRAKKQYNFLTKQEKDSIPPTFIDHYLAWAKTKTQAAEQYHVAGAFTVLSTVFADFGHAVPHWGPTPLNLWFMVLGSTTLSRKSTAKALMLQCIEKLEEGEESYNYDLGSRFTGEGLEEALRNAGNRSVVVHIDEIQGFMKMIDGKSYMAGIKGELTEIYDGKVPGKLRASGEEKDRKRKGARVALNFFAMGIRDQLADYLTLEDFQSGFLTRFVYVSAEAPKRSAETDYVGQLDLTERRNGDPVFDNMIEGLREARETWESWCDPTGRTIAVPCTEEAHARWNKFITDALDAAEAGVKSDVLQASANRLTVSVLKAATLLAMADGHDEVSLNHMLAAISYSGEWFEYLVEMTERISESQWKRNQDKLMELLDRKNGEISWNVAYRAFSAEMTSGKFKEVVQALEDSGRLMLQVSKKKRTLIRTEF